MNNDITNKQLSTENGKTKNNEDVKHNELSNDINNNSNIQVKNENKINNDNNNNDNNKIYKKKNHNNLNSSIISNFFNNSSIRNIYISTINTINAFTKSIVSQNIKLRTECNYLKLFTEIKMIDDESIKKDNYDIKTLDFIKEVKKNEYYLIGGFNNFLYLYGKNFNNPIRVDDKIDDIAYNVSEINIIDPGNPNTIKIALSCVNSIYFYILDLFEGILKTKKIDSNIEYPALQFLEIYVNHQKYHITFGYNGVILYENLCHKIIKEISYPIVKEPVYGGISIFENIIAFVTNNILSQKEKSNKIIFYNVFLKKKVEEIEIDYSISLTQNSLYLMEYTKKNKSHKLLLCACKKYKKNQKNGILIVNYDLSKSQDVKIHFENTGSFEVYCFCQLSDYEKKNQIIILDKNLKKTNYFLVGGFDILKGKGIIKLYKLIFLYNNQNKKVKISFLEDLYFEDGKGGTSKNIRSPISCIIQSNEGRKILVTTWGNKIYSLNYPDIISPTKKNFE